MRGGDLMRSGDLMRGGGRGLDRDQDLFRDMDRQEDHFTGQNLGAGRHETQNVELIEGRQSMMDADRLHIILHFTGRRRHEVKGVQGQVRDEGSARMMSKIFNLQLGFCVN